jgi:hypothetical protein
MNWADARGRWDGMGWIGEFRLDWRTEYFKLRKLGTEDTAYFPSKAEATVAAYEAKEKIERREIRSTGYKQAKLEAAEKLFKPRTQTGG